MPTCQSTYPIYFDQIFFLNPHTWSFIRHAQSRILFRIAQILNSKETIYTYKKASVMGKFTREILYK